MSALLSQGGEVRFQWWTDDCIDVFCSIAGLADHVTRYCFELGTFDEEPLNRFAELFGLVAHGGGLGAVIEPLHYGDFDADDWTAFFLKSGSLPTWPQVLIGTEERVNTLPSAPAGYIRASEGPWRILRYRSFLSYPLR